MILERRKRIRDPLDKFRERFLEEFYLTGQVVFSGGRWGHEKPEATLLLNLARAKFQIVPTVSDSEIYGTFAYVWRKIHRRKKGWNGNIDLAPIDYEGED